MVFLKPLRDLKFADIEQLKSNKTSESDILDYKEQLLEDDDLLKHVSSFANTRGGYLIFGVRETGKGGSPEEIIGIERTQVNKERIEQIILGNIQPRLNVNIVSFDHQDTSKVVVVIEIPDSYLKPHMSRQGDRFYRRYNFEAMPMTEMEVSDAYRRRFVGYQELESYLSEVLDIKEFNPPQIIGQIAVIPTILTRMIETSNTKEFDWMRQIRLDRDYLPSSILTPSSNGVKDQFLSDDGHVVRKLEIHRNGCVHYIDTYLGAMETGKLLFFPDIFCRRLISTLQFATTVYQRYNYFGNVRIVCNLAGIENSTLAPPATLRWRHYTYPSQVAEINIKREFPTDVVESKCEPIASGIMDEVFNSYGLWKCEFFDEEGKLKRDSLF